MGFLVCCETQELGGGGLGGAAEGVCACLTPTACGDVCVICVCVCRSEGEPTGASITVSTLTAFKANSSFFFCFFFFKNSPRWTPGQNRLLLPPLHHRSVVSQGVFKKVQSEARF